MTLTELKEQGISFISEFKGYYYILPKRDKDDTFNEGMWKVDKETGSTEEIHYGFDYLDKEINKYATILDPVTFKTIKPPELDPDTYVEPDGNNLFISV